MGRGPWAAGLRQWQGSEETRERDGAQDEAAGEQEQEQEKSEEPEQEQEQENTPCQHDEEEGQGGDTAIQGCKAVCHTAESLKQNTLFQF